MLLPYSPHDLLPIDSPRNEPHKDDKLYFYENVVKHLIPDMVRMEAAGIPIDLNKVAELEEVVTDVLDKVHEKLRNNNLMLRFLKEVSKGMKKQKTEKLEGKRKEMEEFLKPFDLKNTIHRTYLVNYYLSTRERQDCHLDKWSVIDMKKLLQIGHFPLVESLLKKEIQPWMGTYIERSMWQLAQDKANAWNKNHVEAKVEALDEVDLIRAFNPGSAPQKQDFFAFYKIQSENTTKTGNPQWNREELERLHKLLKVLIEDKSDA